MFVTKTMKAFFLQIPPPTAFHRFTVSRLFAIQEKKKKPYLPADRGNDKLNCCQIRIAQLSLPMPVEPCDFLCCAALMENKKRHEGERERAKKKKN